MELIDAVQSFLKILSAHGGVEGIPKFSFVVPAGQESLTTPYYTRDGEYSLWVLADNGDYQEYKYTFDFARANKDRRLYEKELVAMRDGLVDMLIR